MPMQIVVLLTLLVLPVVYPWFSRKRALVETTASEPAGALG